MTRCNKIIAINSLLFEAPPNYKQIPNCKIDVIVYFFSSLFRLYYGEIHALTGLLYLTIGKIQLHLGKSKQAFEMLKKANAVLMITHGDKHSLVREELKPLLYQATMESTSDIHNGM